MLACKKGDVKLVDVLLASKASALSTNEMDRNKTAVAYAIQFGHLDVLKRLLAKEDMDARTLTDCKIQLRSGAWLSPLMFACKCSETAIVRHLLSLKVDVGIINNKGSSALYYLLFNELRNTRSVHGDEGKQLRLQCADIKEAAAFRATLEKSLHDVEDRRAGVIQQLATTSAKLKLGISDTIQAVTNGTLRSRSMPKEVAEVKAVPTYDSV